MHGHHKGFVYSLHRKCSNQIMIYDTSISGEGSILLHDSTKNYHGEFDVVRAFYLD